MDAAEVGLPLPRAGRTDPWAGARGGRAGGERDPALGVRVGPSPAGRGLGSGRPGPSPGLRGLSQEARPDALRTGPLSPRPGPQGAGREEGWT